MLASPTQVITSSYPYLSAKRWFAKLDIARDYHIRFVLPLEEDKQRRLAERSEDIMSGYAELLGQLQVFKKDVASFRRVVLHAHSPASHDYGSLPVVGTSGGSVSVTSAEQEFEAGVQSCGID